MRGRRGCGGLRGIRTRVGSPAWSPLAGHRGDTSPSVGRLDGTSHAGQRPLRLGLRRTTVRYRLKKLHIPGQL